MEKKIHNRSRYFFTEEEIKKLLKITGKIKVFGPWKTKEKILFCIETIEKDEYSDIELYSGTEETK